MIGNLTEFAAIICLIAIPIYLSNGMALFFGGETPLDFGKKFFDKRPLFGGGKTFKGTIAGIAFGTLGGVVASILFPNLTLLLDTNYVVYGFFLSLGAMLGDITASFIKRRLKVERGETVFLLDQLDFLVGSILLGMVVFTPPFAVVAFLAIFTISIHKFANVVAFKTRIKNVPW